MKEGIMSFCKHCGKEISIPNDVSSYFCPYCGNEQKQTSQKKSNIVKQKQKVRLAIISASILGVIIAVTLFIVMFNISKPYTTAWFNGYCGTWNSSCMYNYNDSSKKTKLNKSDFVLTINPGLDGVVKITSSNSTLKFTLEYLDLNSNGGSDTGNAYAVYYNNSKIAIINFVKSNNGTILYFNMIDNNSFGTVTVYEKM